MKNIYASIFTLVLAACGGGDIGTITTDNVEVERRIYPIPAGCPINSEVWMVAGQSNAANWTWHSDTREVLVLTPQGCVKQSGTFSVGDGIYKNAFQTVAADYTARTGITVVLAIVAGGGVAISEFDTDKEFGKKLESTLNQLKYWKVDRFLWQHGETDAWFRNSPTDYQTRFEDIVNRIKPNKSVHVARSTLCTDIHYDNEIGKKLDELRIKYPGPNTDSIPQEQKYRYDLCHFGNEGVYLFSNLWQQYL